MDFLNKLFGKKQPTSTVANVDITPVDNSALNTLLEQPYGAALPILANRAGHTVTAFVFRESQDRIAELARSGAFKSMHTKAAFIEVGGVILYVTLFKIGDQVFEIWWNWHNPIIRPIFSNLFEQKEFVVGFVSDQPTLDRIERYPSPIQDGLRANRSKLNTSRSWTMDAFDKARAAVEQQYPTPVSLWKANGG